jgi:hypothetical protein
MKVIALLALVGSAAAFAPAQQSRASTSLAAFETELGVQAPVSGNDLHHENEIQTSPVYLTLLKLTRMLLFFNK